MASFPLLRLPLLALAKVLQCSDPFELLIFAQCSRRATNLVPLSKSKNFRIECDSEAKLIIKNNDWTIQKLTEESEFKFKCRDFDCYINESNEDKIYLGEEGSFQELLWYLCDLFKCPIRVIHYSQKLDFGKFSKFLRKVRQRQLSIEKFVIGDQISHGDTDTMQAKWKNVIGISQSINISEKLTINVQIPKYFVYTFKKFPKHLYIAYSSWFTMNNLLQASSCVSINLQGSRLTKHNMMNFLNRWKQGEFPNLECLEVFNDAFSRPEPELPAFEDPLNKVQRNKRIPGNGSTVMFKGVKIRSENGQEAEYRIFGKFFRFIVLSDEDEVVH
ncbi:unnamed protein product [Caenorhabditis brenneri]